MIIMRRVVMVIRMIRGVVSLQAVTGMDPVFQEVFIVRGLSTTISSVGLIERVFPFSSTYFTNTF